MASRAMTLRFVVGHFALPARIHDHQPRTLSQRMAIRNSHPSKPAVLKSCGIRRSIGLSWRIRRFLPTRGRRLCCVWRHGSNHTEVRSSSPWVRITPGNANGKRPRTRARSRKPRPARRLKPPASDRPVPAWFVPQCLLPRGLPRNVPTSPPPAMPPLPQRLDFAAKWAEGLDYRSFLGRHGSEDQRRRWGRGACAGAALRAGSVALGRVSSGHEGVLPGRGLVRRLRQPMPIFEHFASASPRVQLRFFDRDTHPDLAAVTQMCGAARVPAVLFVSEDDFPCGLYGDRTLAKYREMGRTLDGAACATGISLGASPLQDAVVQDWLREFERVQWMLRTSTRLRQKHGD